MGVFHHTKDRMMKSGITGLRAKVTANTGTDEPYGFRRNLISVNM